MAITLNERKYSILQFSYTGGDTIFEATFALGCLTPNHIQVFVEGDVGGLGEQNYLSFTYDRQTETVTVLDEIEIPDGEDEVTVIVQRTVPKESLYLSFNSGADVTRTNMDGMVRYTLMALHEVLDGRWDVSPQWIALYDSMQNLYDTLMDRLDGGADGAVLTKQSSDDYDFEWEVPEDIIGLPEGGNPGDVVVRSDDGYIWAPIESTVPATTPVHGNQSDVDTSEFTVLPSHANSIRVLAPTVEDVYIQETGWTAGDELILQGRSTFTMHLIGKVIGQEAGVDTLLVYNAPMGMFMRYLGDDQWLFLGSGEFSASGA